MNLLSIKTSEKLDRLPYLGISVLTIFLGLLTDAIISAGTNRYGEISHGSAIIALVIIFVTLWIGIVASIQRLHALGQSGWWVLLSFIPIVNIGLGIYLLFWPSIKPLSTTESISTSPNTRIQQTISSEVKPKTPTKTIGVASETEEKINSNTAEEKEDIQPLNLKVKEQSADAQTLLETKIDEQFKDNVKSVAIGFGVCIVVIALICFSYASKNSRETQPLKFRPWEIEYLAADGQKSRAYSEATPKFYSMETHPLLKRREWFIHDVNWNLNKINSRAFKFWAYEFENGVRVEAVIESPGKPTSEDIVFYRKNMCDILIKREPYPVIVDLIFHDKKLSGTGVTYGEELVWNDCKKLR